MTVGRETGEQETVHLFCEQRRTERRGGAGGGVQGSGGSTEAGEEATMWTG